MSQLQHRGCSQAAAGGVATDNDVVGSVAFLEQGVIDRDAILESYRRILNNPNQDRIEPRNASIMVSGDEARVFCVEFVGGGALAATNMFRRAAGAWRMTHHQASPIAALVEEVVTQTPPKRLN